MAAILDAAEGLLVERPDASLGDIATAAGVSRQTVYAHYRSREALLAAVAERALEQSLAAIDGAELEVGTPTEALRRLIGAWWDSVAGHARVLDALAAAYPTAQDVHELHAPILERLKDLTVRGQTSGDFDATLTPAWLAACFVALMHTAAEEVTSSRLASNEASKVLEVTVLRLFGAAD